MPGPGNEFERPVNPFTGEANEISAPKNWLCGKAAAQSKLTHGIVVRQPGGRLLSSDWKPAGPYIVGGRIKQAGHRRTTKKHDFGRGVSGGTWRPPTAVLRGPKPPSPTCCIKVFLPYCPIPGWPGKQNTRVPRQR